LAIKLNLQTAATPPPACEYSGAGERHVFRCCFFCYVYYHDDCLILYFFGTSLRGRSRWESGDWTKKKEADFAPCLDVARLALVIECLCVEFFGATTSAGALQRHKRWKRGKRKGKGEGKRLTGYDYTRPPTHPHATTPSARNVSECVCCGGAWDGYREKSNFFRVLQKLPFSSILPSCPSSWWAPR
jgi:hypothetical protein